MTLIEQLQLKIRLEGMFRREVRTLFSRIRVQYRIGVSAGRQVRAVAYAHVWQAAIERHYSRVQRAFGGIVGKEEKQENNDIERDAVLAALLMWNLNNAQQITGEIIATTQANMDSAIEQARQAFADEGTTQYSNRELALAASVILGRKFLGREQSIVITETQKAAESTKLIEAYGVSGIDPMLAVTRERIAGTTSRKEWQDVGDKDVRKGHHAYEVKPVPIDQPFIVNGERLMYPGDNSMGASAGNTINCRCGSFYTFN